MPRKSHVRMPSDRASDRPEGPNVQKGLSIDGLFVRPHTPETISDAQRAVTRVHLRRPETVEESGMVLAMLGLLPDRPATAEAGVPAPEALDFTCPYCNASPRVRCHSDRGGERPTHTERKRLAEHSPTPEKENPTDG